MYRSRMKSDKKRPLVTCQIDLVATHRRTRSTTNDNRKFKKQEIKKENEDDNSEFDQCDEYEESVGDSTERQKRPSIAEMVTRHKLHTATPISAKINLHFDNPIKIGNCSDNDDSEGDQILNL
jgi:hypothetical protein